MVLNSFRKSSVKFVVGVVDSFAVLEPFSKSKSVSFVAPMAKSILAILSGHRKDRFPFFRPLFPSDYCPRYWRMALYHSPPSGRANKREDKNGNAQSSAVAELLIAVTVDAGDETVHSYDWIGKSGLPGFDLRKGKRKIIREHFQFRCEGTKSRICIKKLMAELRSCGKNLRAKANCPKNTQRRAKKKVSSILWNKNVKSTFSTVTSLSLKTAKAKAPLFPTSTHCTSI